MKYKNRYAMESGNRRHVEYVTENNLIVIVKAEI